MLVLSRKRNEKIVITTPGGDVIEVAVVEIRGDKCRLGFSSSNDVIIDREEVHESKKREGNQSR